MSYHPDVASATMAAVFAAFAMTSGVHPAAAHDVSAASRASEEQGDLPPCSLELEIRLDCHIHDPVTFREMRRNPPGEGRPHAHEEYEQEDSLALEDTRGGR